MTPTHRSYTAIAAVIFAIALLHLAAAGLARPAYDLANVAAAALLALLGLGLLWQSRLCAYLAFIGILFGASASLAIAMTAQGTLVVVMGLILALDVFAVMKLFAALWAEPKPA